MFFKTDAEKAAKQAARVRHDAGEAGTSAASGARNLSAAALASLAEVTAPQDDRKGRRHAKKARAKALKAASKDREAITKAAEKARSHGTRAADHGRAALKETAEHRRDALKETAGHGRDVLLERGQGASEQLSAIAGKTGSRASEGAHRAAEAASHAAQAARERTAPLSEAAAEKAGMGAALMGALAAAAREKASETRHRAVSGIDHGIDVGVPRAQERVAAVAPQIDHLRDVINEDLLPRMQAMLDEVKSSKDRTLAKGDGKVAAKTGAPKRKKKGKVLIAVGLLAAAGAGVAWWFSQQKSPATDPWASQSGAADPWASQTAVTTSPATETDPLPGQPTAAVAAVGDATPAPTGDVAASGSTLGSASGDNPHMLQSEEIDAMGSDEPLQTEEQGKGETPAEEIEAARAKDRPVGGEPASDADNTDPRQA